MPAVQRTPARRAWRMAAMGADVAGSYIGYLVQGAFLGEAERRTRLKSAHTRAASRVRDEMQVLRGPIMKLGQALSMQAGVLPEEALAELSKLQMEAPGMHPSLVRAHFKGSLGAYPEEIFRTFVPEPFAAASLGQVHHAVTREGAAVAVKIQYPGIREAIANDFTWFRTVSKPMQASGYLPKTVLDELQEQIVAETDYGREADNIEFFARSLAPLPFVTVPRVYREYSSDKILTMSRVSGQHLDRFMATRPSQQLRDTIGERLFELFYFQELQVEALHADPHWGNYLFNADGSIGLVDFGCVKYFQPEFVEDLRRVYLYPGSRTSDEFLERLDRRYTRLGKRLPASTRRALATFSEDFYRTVYPPEPEKQKRPFDFSDAAFLENYLRNTRNLLKSKGMLPEYLFLARAEMGLYHTLHRLGARVHTSRIVAKQLQH